MFEYIGLIITTQLLIKLNGNDYNRYDDCNISRNSSICLVLPIFRRNLTTLLNYHKILFYSFLFGCYMANLNCVSIIIKMQKKRNESSWIFKKILTKEIIKPVNGLLFKIKHYLC